MANVKGVYDGFWFDFDLPQDRPVTGEEIKDRVDQALGQKTEGATAIRRSNGEFEHVGAHDHIQVQPGDSVTIARPFETAGGIAVMHPMEEMHDDLSVPGYYN